MSSTATQLRTVTYHKGPIRDIVEEVALHNICQNCTTFFQQWGPLQWFLDPERTRDWPYSSYLCTVTELVESQQHCHFCKLLLASLDRRPFVKREDVSSMSVWMHFQDEDANAVTMNTLISEKQPLKKGEGRDFTVLVLQRYEGVYDWSLDFQR
jgi:hypothetical protein